MMTNMTTDMMNEYRYKILWTYVANGILGLWLISNVFLFDYKSNALVTSDAICGAAIIVSEFFSFFPRLAKLRWLTPAMGFWLLFAPFIFWSPTPAIYLTDTLIACLLISFSILIPGIPGKDGIKISGPDKPPGWTYNPSSWIRRWLGIALALMGFFLSRYLAAHQLGYIPHAWDPFFGDGTDKVTGSHISKSFPISDAGFGSVAYMLEVLAGFLGDRARWRTAPFTVVTFALLVIPLGATSIILVIMQPVAVGAWCGLCLISAIGLIISVPLAVHEAIAVGQFLIDSIKQKKNFWHVFWLGGSIEGGAADPDRSNYSIYQRWLASVQGVTVPWTLAIQLIIGIWLMARPDILPFTKISADCDHLIGALVVTVAAIACAEVTRIIRYLNILLGVSLIIVAFLFALPNLAIFCSELVSGILLVILSIPRGAIVERYADWDTYVK